MSLVLTKRILRSHPNKFVGAIVEGHRGVGKSAYCIKIMKEVYQEYYNCSEYKAYNIALDHMLFDLDDVIPFLKNASDSDSIVPVVTWDDAGVHGSSIRWFTNLRQVELLKAMTDTIRTAVTGFLINCPDRSSLLKVLRNYDDYTVKISVLDGNYMRQARGYNVYKLPSGSRRVYKNFADNFSCYIPKEIYNKYMVMRKSYFDKAVAAMEEMKNRIGRPKIPKDINSE